MHRSFLLSALFLSACFDAHALTDAGSSADAARAADAGTEPDASSIVRCAPASIGGVLGEPCFCNGPIAADGPALYRRGVSHEVYDLARPDAPTPVRTIDERSSSAGALLISSSRHALFSVTDIEPGVWVYDITSPLEPALLTRVELTGGVVGGALDGDTLVVAATDGEASGLLHVIDVSSPSLPVLASSLPIARRPSAVALEGRTAAVASFTGTSTSLDLIDVGSGAVIASIPSSGSAFGRALAMRGDLVYLTGGDVTLTVLRRDGSTLRSLGVVGPPTFGSALALEGTLALIGGDRMRIVDVADPARLRVAGESAASLGDSGALVWRGDLAYVSGGNGLAVVSLGCE